MRIPTFAAALFLAVSPVMAQADMTVPSQAEWVGAKQVMSLPNGIEMAYVEMGNPQGKPMLMIHGFSDSSRTWSNVAPFLADRRMLAVDLRGHGDTTVPDCCFTTMEMTNDVSLFLKAMDVGKVDVLGHSMGTRVAQMLAALHPEQVDRLVLLAGDPSSIRKPGGWLWDNVMALKDPIDPDSQFMKDWYSRPKPLDPADMDIYARKEAAAMPARVWQNIQVTGITMDLSGLDAMIEAPTLIVAGGLDALMNEDSQTRFRAALPHARFELVEDAGHGLFKEQPERVGGMIDDFLKSGQ